MNRHNLQDLRLSLETTEDLITVINIIKDFSDLDWSYFWGCLNGNFDLELVIDRFQSHINWESLSKNINIGWDLLKLSKYESYLDWKLLSVNEGVRFDEIILDKFVDKWQWEGDRGGRKYSFYKHESLSSNPALPLSVSLVEKYESKWDWRALGLNKKIQVYQTSFEYSDEEEYRIVEESEKILSRFKDKWHFERSKWYDNNAAESGYEKTSIFDNRGIKWHFPKLSEIFGGEIMNFNKTYHEAVKFNEKVYLDYVYKQPAKSNTIGYEDDLPF